MPFLSKLLLTNLVIIGCVYLGKKIPSLAGLIAAMPLTTLAVLFWLHADNPDYSFITDYTRGVLWGIIPTALFFGATLFCLRRGVAFPITIAAAFSVWLAAAAFHQWLLR